MSKQQKELWRIIGILHRKGYQDGIPSEQTQFANTLVKDNFIIWLGWLGHGHITIFKRGRHGILAQRYI